MRSQKVKSHFQLLRSNLTESEGRRIPLLRSNYAVRLVISGRGAGMMVQSSADRDLRLMSKDLWPLRDYLIMP